VKIFFSSFTLTDGWMEEEEEEEEKKNRVR